MFGRNGWNKVTEINKLKVTFNPRSSRIRVTDGRLVSRSDSIWTKLKMLAVIRDNDHSLCSARGEIVGIRKSTSFSGKSSRAYEKHAAPRERRVAGASSPSKTGTADSRYLTDAVLIFRAATRGAPRLARNRHTLV